MATALFDINPENILNFNPKSSLELKSVYSQGIKYDTPIFRYYELIDLIYLLIEKKNKLVKPERWDDPYENILLKQILRTKDGVEYHLHELRKEYYAQCWTLNKDESDALWRIYSPNKSRIRVRTTIGKLYETFCKGCDNGGASRFIGKVNYKSKDDITTFLNDPKTIKQTISDNEEKKLVKTLLVKRNEFVHENEIRLIYRGNERRDDLENPIFCYDIDPSYLIEEILFDPRIDKTFYYYHKNIIQKELNFDGEIKMSDLYEIPLLKLIVDKF